MITDMMGKVKGSQSWNSGEDQFVIPISLEPGTYIIKISTADFKSVDRILVK